MVELEVGIKDFQMMQKEESLPEAYSRLNSNTNM
jgi:hypothetical protein